MPPETAESTAPCPSRGWEQEPDPMWAGCGACNSSHPTPYDPMDCHRWIRDSRKNSREPWTHSIRLRRTDNSNSWSRRHRLAGMLSGSRTNMPSLAPAAAKWPLAKSSNSLLFVQTYTRLILCCFLQRHLSETLCSLIGGRSATLKPKYSETFHCSTCRPRGKILYVGSSGLVHDRNDYPFTDLSGQYCETDGKSDRQSTSA